MFRNAVLLPKSTLMLANKDPGFPGSSAGKESACNAGDPGSISQSGRSPGEGAGYPLQYSWASLVAQLVKNPPTMWKAWVVDLVAQMVKRLPAMWETWV